MFVLSHFYSMDFSTRGLHLSLFLDFLKLPQW